MVFKRLETKNQHTQKCKLTRYKNIRRKAQQQKKVYLVSVGDSAWHGYTEEMSNQSQSPTSGQNITLAFNTAQFLVSLKNLFIYS